MIRQTIDGGQPDMVVPGYATIYTIFDRATSVSTSRYVAIPNGEITAQAYVKGDGQVTATIEVWGTLRSSLAGKLLGTFILSGTDSAEDSGPAPNDRITQFPIIYGKLIDISGTDAEAFLEVAV